MLIANFVQPEGMMNDLFDRYKATARKTLRSTACLAIDLFLINYHELAGKFIGGGRVRRPRILWHIRISSTVSPQAHKPTSPQAHKHTSTQVGNHTSAQAHETTKSSCTYRGRVKFLDLKKMFRELGRVQHTKAGKKLAHEANTSQCLDM